MKRTEEEAAQDRKDKHFEGRMSWIDVKEGSKAYREHVAKERKRLGLEPLDGSV